VGHCPSAVSVADAVERAIAVPKATAHELGATTGW
jgi:hypothetical protein